ncbi:MAG: cytochrome c oxidase subunit 3 [Polyangiaceae bacterium]
MSEASHAAHFESATQQTQAARLGMWVFLGSELLLFAGLLALYAGARLHSPVAFRAGIQHASKLIGSLNTAILLLSSTAVAAAVELLRRGRRNACIYTLLLTIGLGGAFLALKFTEYAGHFSEGIYPGGAGSFFLEHRSPGLAAFWTLYFFTTGLHAVHVSVGLLVLGITARRVSKGTLHATHLYALENAALYWHLIDLIWIFLWPMYYLA